MEPMGSKNTYKTTSDFNAGSNNSNSNSTTAQHMEISSTEDNS